MCERRRCQTLTCGCIYKCAVSSFLLLVTFSIHPLFSPHSEMYTRRFFLRSQTAAVRETLSLILVYRKKIVTFSIKYHIYF